MRYRPQNSKILVLDQSEGADKALERLFCATEGNATVALLSLKEGERALSLLHNNRTVGFNLWVNSKGELLFCSRWEPVEELLGELLKKGSFKRKIFIDYGETAAAYFCLKPPLP